MPPAVDLTNQKFGRLTAIEVVFDEKGERRWRCECSCGGETLARAAALRFGDKVSCGCSKGKVPGICLVCGKSFERKPSRVGKYCSHACYWVGKNGSTAWNKGMKGIPSGRKGKKFGPQTEHHRAKISSANKGKRKRRSYPTGADHPMWKGGINSERSTLMNSAEYKQLLRTVFKRDKYTCTICGDLGPYLHLDHIKDWSSHPELRFEASNCRTLCRPCHYRVTFGREMPAKSRWGITKGRRYSLLGQ